MYTIDLLSRVPIYEQLEQQTKRMILLGVLKPNDRLESVRSLSVKLSVNPNTIQRAYTQMTEQNIIYSVSGKGCFVSEHAYSSLKSIAENSLELLCDTVKHLALAGIDKRQVQKAVDEAYSKGEKRND